MPEPKHDRPAVDEDELYETMTLFRRIYSKLVRLPVVHPAGKEGKDELIEIITAVGMRMRQVIEDLKEIDAAASGLEDELSDLEMDKASALRLVEMVQDMERRIVTPRELITYVRENFE